MPYVLASLLLFDFILVFVYFPTGDGLGAWAKLSAAAFGGDGLIVPAERDGSVAGARAIMRKRKRLFQVNWSLVLSLSAVIFDLFHS